MCVFFLLYISIPRGFFILPNAYKRTSSSVLQLSAYRRILQQHKAAVCVHRVNIKPVIPYMRVFFIIKLFFLRSSRRYPAYRLSLLILHPINRYTTIPHKLWSQNCDRDISTLWREWKMQCNAMPSYWTHDMHNIRTPATQIHWKTETSSTPGVTLGTGGAGCQCPCWSSILQKPVY